MFCRKCGMDIGDAQFCPSCGHNQSEGVNVNNNQNYNKPVETDMSVGDWVIALILTLIPIVGIVFLIIWAVGGTEKKPSRKNWAIAQLVIVAVLIVITVLFVVVLGFSIGSK